MMLHKDEEMLPERPRTSVSSDVLGFVSRLPPDVPGMPEIEWSHEISAWLVRSHEAIRYVLRNDERLFRLAHPEVVAPTDLAALRGGKRTHRLLRGDEHERIHRWYMKWFLPAEVERYTPTYILPEVDRIIDRFAGTGRAELCHAFCEPLGPRVIAAVLGLPVDTDDDDYFEEAQRFNDAVLAWNSAPEDAGVLERGVRASQRLNEMLLPTVRAKKDSPGDDLISRMWKEGPAIVPGWGEEDVLVATREMLLGASGTTREALANALYLLFTDGRVRGSAFAESRRLLANFVEESLRLQDSRIILALPRIANEDVEVAGATIRSGQTVVLLTDQGNTDETHYAEAREVDLSRPSPKDHFAFGAGPRACIGANLGRAQVRVALERIFARLPDLALDPDRERPHRSGVGGGFGKSAYFPLHVRF